VVNRLIYPLKQRVAHGNFSSIASCRTKIMKYEHFEGYLGFFAEFQKVYLFIPEFLAEPLAMFCGALESLDVTLLIASPLSILTTFTWNASDNVAVSFPVRFR
jgi:hypothetical protein